MRIDENAKEIAVEIPLTSPTGKIRIKERSSAFEYGLPFASRQRELHPGNYIEWQIGYDWPSGAGNPSSLPKIVFTNNKGEEKSLYELSELLYYFYRWNFISAKEIETLSGFLNKLEDGKLIDRHSECGIKRGRPVKREINGVIFSRMALEYPQLVFCFRKYEIIAEITVREKQRAVGVQPMLYFCFPVSELRTRGRPLAGRTAEQNETADFIFNRNNRKIILGMVKIFGMLSKPHKADITAILNAVLESSRA